MNENAGKKQVAVLISGSGSNLQALIDASQGPDYPAEIVLVISNRPDAYGLQRAEKAGIKNIVIDHKNYANRASFETALHDELSRQPIDIICLAGFMRILNTEFVEKWQDKMINIHPSLLPAYKGLNTFERALDDGVRFAGCTIHYVVPEMDAGPIVMQVVVPIQNEETPDSLRVKIQTEEHKMYPAALKLIADGRVYLKNGIVQCRNSDLAQSSLCSPVY